jgi:hypothetical protein
MGSGHERQIVRIGPDMHGCSFSWSSPVAGGSWRGLVTRASHQGCQALSPLRAQPRPVSPELVHRIYPTYNPASHPDSYVLAC